MDSDYVKNQPVSLLLQMLGGGSGDNLPIIFKHVASLKEKIRLERVCKKFRQHAMSFVAWSNVKYIVFQNGAASEFCLINKDDILAEKLTVAIESIMYRCRNVQCIYLDSCRYLRIAFPSITQSLLHSGITYRNVNGLCLSGHMSAEISNTASKIIDAFQSKLLALKLTEILFYDPNDMSQLWIIIGKCTNLKEFHYHDFGSREGPDMPSSDMIKKALYGKPIIFLGVYVYCLKTEDFFDIISSLNNRKCLALNSNTESLSLIDFAQRIPEAYRCHVKSIRYEFFYDVDHTEPSKWSVILNFPRIFPELFFLKLYFDVGAEFNCNQTVELVVSYLAILSEKTNGYNNLQIVLISSTFNEDWITCFASLLPKQQNLNVNVSVAGHFKINNAEEKEQCYIDIEIHTEPVMLALNVPI